MQLHRVSDCHELLTSATSTTSRVNLHCKLVPSPARHKAVPVPVPVPEKAVPVPGED